MWDSSFVIWLIHNSKLECNKTPRFTCKETWLKCRIYSLPKCRFAFLTCQWQPLRKPSRTCKLKQPFLLPEFSSSWLSSFNKITRWLPNSTSVPQILPCCGESFKNMHCRTISLLDAFVLALCVQEEGTTPLPKEPMNDCLQGRRTFLARGKELPALLDTQSLPSNNW